MYGRPPRWQSERNPSLVTVLEMFQQPIPGLPGVPEELTDVLRAGMDNDPGARPSALELRGMLAALPLDAGPAPVSSAPVSGAPVSPTGGGSTAVGSYTVGRSGQPAQRPPFEDAQPTVPAPGRRWRRRWFLGGAGALALAASASAGAWLASATPAGGSPAPVATGVSAPVAGPDVLPGCRPGSSGVDLPPGAHCVPELECFGPVRVRGDRAEAVRIPCDGRHTWEAYAEGDLPDRLVGAGHAAISADPAVRGVCNVRTFRLTSGISHQAGWNLEVLPPAGTAADRTYRCLAGRGVDALAAPTLTGR